LRLIMNLSTYYKQLGDMLGIVVNR